MPDSSPSSQRSVCFVVFDAGPIIFPDALGAIGGAETRAVLMARALADDPQVDVSLVIRDSRSRPTQVFENVRVVTKQDRLFRVRRFVSEHVTVLKSFPWIRISRWHVALFWLLPLLFFARLFRKKDSIEEFRWLVSATNCDVYCCMGVSERSAQVVDTVKQQHRKTILFIASDADLDERYVSVPHVA